MAKALQFDGVDDYAELTSVVTLTGDFDINYKFKSAASIPNTMAIARTNSGSNGWLGRWNGDFLFYWGGVIHSERPAFSPDTEYTVRLWRVGSTCQFTINGTTYTPFTNFNNLIITRFSDTGGLRFGGYLEYFTVNGLHNWNSDSSNTSNTGQQPVWVDTISSNHANGYNFPTDGSAWESTGGGVTRLSRDISLVTGFSQRLAHDTTINTAMLDRKPSDTTISTALLERKSNDTQIHTGLLTRLTQNTEIEFSLLSRLSRTTQIHTALFERKSRDYDVAFSLLERKIKNTNIVTGILNRLSNDIAIVTGMLGAKSRDYTISFALLERQQNSVAIQFSIEGDKVPRVQLTPKAIPTVQLAYLADETQVIQITPITPTKIQLQ